jgi:hypothetical protein
MFQPFCFFLWAYFHILSPIFLYILLLIDCLLTDGLGTKKTPPFLRTQSKQIENWLRHIYA